MLTHEQENDYVLPEGNPVGLLLATQVFTSRTKPE